MSPFATPPFAPTCTAAGWTAPNRNTPLTAAAPIFAGAAGTWSAWPHFLHRAFLSAALSGTLKCAAHRGQEKDIVIDSFARQARCSYRRNAASIVPWLFCSEEIASAVSQLRITSRMAPT